MSKISHTTLGLVALLLFLGAATVLAQGVVVFIHPQVFDSGGALMSSDDGDVVMTGSLGQPVIGLASSASYSLGSGYEYGIELIVDDEPTVITLVSFTAHSSDEGVIVAWETGTEIDNAGFNLYRATTAAGPYIKVNDVLIPAKGDPVTGASYSYLDAAAVGETVYYYQLEDIDFFGVSTMHGPVDTATGLAGGPPSDSTYLPLIIKQDSIND